MLKKITLKKILIVLLILLVVIQFFRIDKTNPPVDQGQDFLVVTKTPAQIATVIKTSCYDCHSNESKYPWYTNVAPLSWFIKDHINEGRRELNFSIWGTYNARRMDKKIKKCVEEIEEDEMPLSSYTWLHRDAKLSKENKTALMDWFNSLRTHESDKPREEK